MSSEANISVPSWLTESGGAGCKTKASGTGFITGMMKSFSQVFENEFYCEKYASVPAYLQAIDGRVKLLVLLAFMIFSSFASSIPVLAALAVIAAVYALLSRLRLGDYLRRIWAYIPLIVFIFSLPGCSSFFVTGTPLFYLIPRGAPGFAGRLYFTAGGIGMAFRLALRPGISLSFAFLLLLTTKWSKLMQSLRALHLPGAVVSIISMTYRYIFIICDIASSMSQARYMRSVGRLASSDSRRYLGRSAAFLFIRSHKLSEDVYDAMTCRCYSGRAPYISPGRISAADYAFIFSNILIILILTAGEIIF